MLAIVEHQQEENLETWTLSQARSRLGETWSILTMWVRDRKDTLRDYGQKTDTDLMERAVRTLSTYERVGILLKRLSVRVSRWAALTSPAADANVVDTQFVHPHQRSVLHEMEPIG